MFQRVVIFVLTVTGLLVLGLGIGIGGYLLGQQMRPMPTIAAFAPTRQPPQIVTNTPSPTALPSPTYTPTPIPTDTPTPTPTPIAVLSKMSALGRLETTEFALQTVIEQNKENENWWGRLIGGDSLVLVAEGEVVAGFDLEKLRDDDVEVDGKRVVIVLPAPEILYSRLDNEKSYVYQRETGFLSSPDLNLEGEARQQAEQRMRDWALERGILEQAEKHGRLQLENLLLNLGFNDILIQFREEPL